MADYTENYNLKKPDRTDFYSVQDFNDNADIIDAALDDKLNKDFSNISSGAGGAVPIANGGTGATTAAQALINLGVESNYGNLSPNVELTNQNILTYVNLIESPRCGFFSTEDCTGTPDDTSRWWSFNLAINDGARKVLFAYRVSDFTNATCDIWVNQRWYVNTAFTWCGWRKILTSPQNTNVGVTYVTSSTPSTAQNNDLWAW